MTPQQQMWHILDTLKLVMERLDRIETKVDQLMNAAKPKPKPQPEDPKPAPPPEHPDTGTPPAQPKPAPKPGPKP